MKLHLGSFDTFPVKWENEFDGRQIRPVFDSLLAVKSGRVRLDIQKTESEYYCQGEVTAVASLECSRCLEPFDTELVSEIDFIVCGRDHYDSLKSEAVDDEDYVFIDSSDHSADITKPVDEALILAVSMKPLCDENCKGICAVCGKNLNRTSCDCSKKKIDPRWDALKGLSGA